MQGGMNGKCSEEDSKEEDISNCKSLAKFHSLNFCNYHKLRIVLAVGVG